MRRLKAGKIILLILLIGWIAAHRQYQPELLPDAPSDHVAMTTGELLMSFPSAISSAEFQHDF